MSEPSVDGEEALVAGFRGGDENAFEILVSRHRRELLAHCYRMLGSVHDAEDALQESLVAAWRARAGFEGRSSWRAWIYRIATNACIRLGSRRPRRLLSPDHGPARTDAADLGEIVTGPVWLEPWPDRDVADDSLVDPAVRWVQRETVELAFVAALQHLPASQRAVLILREVLAFSAAEVAEMLETTVPAVNSGLQRARKAVAERVPDRSQQAELALLGSAGQRRLLASYLSAWERADVPALVELLTEDARFAMPPLPAWFDGRDDVRRFLTERVFAEADWRLVEVEANGQPAFACYQRLAGAAQFRLGAVNLLTLRAGRIAGITGFLDPDAQVSFGLPEVFDDQQLGAER